MNIDIPKDLLNKTNREIKEMISEVGLVNFSKIFSLYLENSNNLSELKNNPDLLEKIASTLDSILMYYQMSKNNKEKQIKDIPINNDLINRFMDIYTLCSKDNYVNCRS